MSQIYLSKDEKEQFKKEWDSARSFIKFRNVPKEVLTTAIIQIHDVLDDTACWQGSDSQCTYIDISECRACRLAKINSIIKEIYNY